MFKKFLFLMCLATGMRSFADTVKNTLASQSLFYNGGTPYTRSYVGSSEKQYVVTEDDIPLKRKWANLPQVELMVNEFFKVKDKIFLQDDTELCKGSSDYSLYHKEELATQNTLLSLFLIEVVSQIVTEAEKDIHDKFSEFSKYIKKLHTKIKTIKKLQDTDAKLHDIRDQINALERYLYSIVNVGLGILTSIKDLTVFNKPRIFLLDEIDHQTMHAIFNSFFELQISHFQNYDCLQQHTYELKTIYESIVNTLKMPNTKSINIVFDY